MLVLRRIDVLLSFSTSLFIVATYNKTNRGNSVRRAMGKEPRGTQKNAKGTGKRKREIERETGTEAAGRAEK